MLNDIFSWFTGNLVELDFTPQKLTRSVFESEHAHALVRRRTLLADLYSARGDKAPAEIISDIANFISQQDSCLSFIASFAKELGALPHVNPFLLSLKYLIAVGDDDKFIDQKEEKINRIFFELLRENKEEALAFFYANQKYFDGYMQVNLMVSAEKTTDYLAQLTTKLHAQENVLSIVHYFEQCLDDEEKFAAMVLWMVRRGLLSHRIIETDLLQKFMLYHAAWLGTPNNSVQHFYNLLGMFPETRELVEEASKVQCEDRSFHCEEGGTHSHSIKGALSLQSTLHRVEIKVSPLEFTPTAENFDALYSLFGSLFLNDALRWHAGCDNATWRAALHDFFNREASIAEQLPILLNFIGGGGRSSVLKALASLIDDATVEKLVTRHSGSVLHLLPYKPFLLNRVDEGFITHYLDEIKLLQSEAWDVISQLLAVLVAFRDVNKAVALQVYEAIVDLVLEHPHVLDDDYLLKQLRKIPEAETILTNRYQQLQSQFDRCVTEQVVTGTLNTANYHIIEDSWLNLSRKVVLLNEIISIPNNCPNDKYRLQAHWAKSYFSMHAGTFVIDDYVEALEVVPELLADRVSEYERVLIELLTTIDDDGVRDMIIAKFDANEARRDQWLQTDYSNGCVFNRAAEHGNVGLIRWLERRVVIDPDAINHAVRIAADAQQWNVVEYFCSASLHKPQQAVLKELLSLAAKAGQSRTIQFLCDGAVTQLQAKHIEQVLNCGAAYGYLNIVEYCCHRDTCAPSATMVAKALKRSIQLGHGDVGRFIGNLPPNAQLLTVVERELVHAAMHDQVSIVQLLCDLLTNTPRQPVIEEAFIKAIKFGNLKAAQSLYNLPINAPRQKAIDEALEAAIANGYLPGVQFLFHLPARCPRQGAVERALVQAIHSKRLDIVQFLCGLDVASPRPHMINQAILLAAKLGNLPMVVFFGRLVNSKLIEQTIQVAAKQGHLGIVQCCCEIKPPSRKAMFDARKKAMSSGHNDVADYFSGLLEPATVGSRLSLPPSGAAAFVPHLELPVETSLLAHPEPRRATGSPRFVAARSLERANMLRKSSSCQALDAFGMFGSRGGLVRASSLSELSAPSSLVSSEVVSSKSPIMPFSSTSS